MDDRVSLDLILSSSNLERIGITHDIDGAHYILVSDYPREMPSLNSLYPPTFLQMVHWHSYSRQ